MKVSEVVRALENFAPLNLAAEWDNVGLLIGERGANVTRLMLCIDLSEAVLAEAAAARAQMVMAYHPVIFKGVMRVTDSDAPVVYAAAKKGIAVHCLHTAFDAAQGGTNDVLADVLGLVDRRPLVPTIQQDQCKIVVFVSAEDMPAVSEAAFAAGAGRINGYQECAFFTHGIGSFFAPEQSHPAVGSPGEHEAVEELRLEMIAPKRRAAAICQAVRAAHGYETPAIDVYPLDNHPEGCGMGRVGRLARPTTVQSLITRIKKATGCKQLNLCTASASQGRSGDGKGTLVSTAACCAGSCGGMFARALAGGATFYLTGDMRHHDALAAAAGGMTVVTVGHSNSERLALARLAERLKVSAPKLKVILSKADRDPFRIA